MSNAPVHFSSSTYASAFVTRICVLLTSKIWLHIYQSVNTGYLYFIRDQTCNFSCDDRTRVGRCIQDGLAAHITVTNMCFVTLIQTSSMTSEIHFTVSYTKSCEELTSPFSSAPNSTNVNSTPTLYWSDPVLVVIPSPIRAAYNLCITERLYTLPQNTHNRKTIKKDEILTS